MVSNLWVSLPVTQFGFQQKNLIIDFNHTVCVCVTFKLLTFYLKYKIFLSQICNICGWVHVYLKMCVTIKLTLKILFRFFFKKIFFRFFLNSNSYISFVNISSDDNTLGYENIYCI